MEVKIDYKLNQIMYERNISFRQLERMSGVSSSQLNDIANNKKDTTVATICKIAAALKIKPEELYSYKIL